jgi:TatD DNase family protein
VRRILTVAVDLAAAEGCLELAADNDTVEAAVGIHPSCASGFETERSVVRELLSSSRVRAVGEIGLDFNRCPVPRSQQMQAFRTQVQWAAEIGLPVIVHDRDAHEEVLAVLSEFGVRGVLHCFSGDAHFAEQVTSLGLFVSFAGNVTYKNATDIHEAARVAPLERILIETDSPYLPPQPWRGRRNEPAYVEAVATRVAELRGCEVTQVQEATSANAAALFGWS